MVMKCQTLRCLELIGHRVPDSPSHVFAGITTLHLEKCLVGIVFDVLPLFPNLAHLCLINLTDFETDEDYEDFFFFEDRVGRISGPKLLSLRMETDIRYRPSTCHKVELSAPNLTVFRYKGLDELDDFSVIHLPSLQLAQTLLDADLPKHRKCSFSKLKSLKLLVDFSPSGLSIPPEIMMCLLSGTPHPESVDIELLESLDSISLDFDNPCGLVDW
ncbi:hypothetical protein Tsubulata_035039 [Turnera subulata]|uniref:Uncharacterized protein n=1 Tax=Turnera subulata TaxID=218843 RepID=A0A9Q0FWM3_9ROSI|nr:hypothetical protein Tsubulata_035039 [Turnera subulata]